MGCMDPQEQRFLDGTLAFLREVEPQTATLLRGHLDRVEGMASMAHSFPSLLSSHPVSHMDGDLVETLCQVDSGMSSFSLPIRAVMGDAFLTAKIQLLQTFRNALGRVEGHEVPRELLEDAEREVSQSVYTMLLAALLWDLVRNKRLKLPIRHKAATELVRLWESPDTLEVDDFFPVLEAAWRARNRITVTYGSLIGTAEFFALVREDCPSQFVSFFTRQDVSPSENAAFREFLFGLPQEELEQLRHSMSDRGLDVIDEAFADDHLGSERVMRQKTAEALYGSYRRRQKAAQLRRMVGAPGPRQTAEAYLILYLLARKVAAERAHQEG